MAKQKDTGGCGTCFILFAILCAIGQFIEENYITICIVLGIITFIILFCIFFKHKKKNENKVSQTDAKQITTPPDKHLISEPSSSDCATSLLEKVENQVVDNSNITPESVQKHLAREEVKLQDQNNSEIDFYFVEAGRFTIEKGIASIGMLQRLFKISFSSAARIMDQLGEAGVVGPEDGVKPRKVIMSMEDFEEYLKLYPEIVSEKNKQENTVSTNVQNKRSLEFATIKEYSAFVEKIIEKPVDYSKDGKLLSNLQNMIITQVSEQTKFDLLDDLIRYNSFATLRLFLFDKNQFNFFNYRDVPNLIGEIVFDPCKLNAALNWMYAEMGARTKLFLEHHVKNIFDYNEGAKLDSYPYLPIFVVIIDELYGLDNILTDNLNQILLDSGRRGLFVIGFSRMNLKNLSLGSSKFLWQHYIDSQVSGMFSPVHDTSNDAPSSSYDSMEGHDFEYFCADLLKCNGFRNVSVTQGSGDQGIDILAEKEGVQYGIQCKCYTSDIGNKAVQEAFAGKVFYNCHVAAVLTNQHFTKSAIELAQVNKVLLWDREKLDSFIKNAN